MRIAEVFEGAAPVRRIAFALLLVALVGILDFATGTELSFSTFYLIPVSLAAWYAGPAPGFAIAGASAVCWLMADLGAGHVYSHAALPYWNALVRLGMFAIVTGTLVALRRSRHRQEELVHFVVHDLRAPLANVTLALDGLVWRDPGDGPALRMLEIARASCQRMMLLIDSLLDAAALEAGRLSLRPNAVAIDDLITTALEQVALIASRNRQEIALRRRAEGLSVRADREVTARVLVNLLGNAIKFSPPGSRIVIDAAPEGDGEVGVAVENPGPGIPAPWVARVFDKFSRIEARKAGAAGGSGLGLTFCRLAIEAQGGRIRVESEVDRSTRVTFTLPRTDRLTDRW